MAEASQAFIINGTPNNGVSFVRTFNADLGLCIVRRVIMTWPAGCGGLLFLAINAGGGFAFPNQQGQMMAFDDYTYAFDVTNQTSSGKWTVLIDNRDFITHDPQVVFEFDYLRGNSNSGQLIPIPI